MFNDEMIALLPTLRSGDPSAERRLFDACLPKLTAILRRRFLVLPAGVVMDAAVDALLELMLHSERYNAHKGSLLNYLVHIGDHKLLDEIRRLERRREKYVGGTVELALVEAKQYREADYPDVEIGDPDTLPPDVQALIEEILPDPADREALALVLRGRTGGPEFAAIWGCDHLPPEAQAKRVKQNRDRILNRVKRKRQGFRRLLYGES